MTWVGWPLPPGSSVFGGGGVRPDQLVPTLTCEPHHWGGIPWWWLWIFLRPNLTLTYLDLMPSLYWPVAEPILPRSVFNLWTDSVVLPLRPLTSNQSYLWFCCCSCCWWDGGKCLTTHWLHSWRVVFADFRGVNIPALADFKLPMWAWSWDQRCGSILCSVSTTQINRHK